MHKIKFVLVKQMSMKCDYLYALLVKYSVVKPMARPAHNPIATQKNKCLPGSNWLPQWQRNANTEEGPGNVEAN